ncbi:MAG: DUF1573 domain-containing protein [Oligoflexales bacterium]|nr:DUF1573 domain-containing protein [Oligoflexales bacterium]
MNLSPKKLILTSVSILIFLIFSGKLWAVVPTKSKNTGKIKFLNQSVDFGKVAQGQVLNYRFHFKNAGEGPLRILGIHATCGCTAIESEFDKPYPKGEHGYIDINFDTSAFVGITHKAVTVMTNEKLSPNRTLSLKANIVADYLVNKPVLDFGNISTGTDKSEDIIISPVSKFPLEISKVSYDQSRYEVSYEKSKENWNLKVTLKKQEKIGFLKDKILIHTNSKSLPQFKLVVRAFVEGPINTKPEYIEFGAVGKNKISKRLIKLNSVSDFSIKEGSANLHLNGLEVKDPKDIISWKASKVSRNGQEIELTLQNLSKDSGSVHGSFTFVTDDPVQKEIFIDFYAFFL